MYDPDFCWHHFVFAINCNNGLIDYYQAQDATFTQYTKPINTTPEEVVLRLCDKLWYAPLTHKTTAQRAMEFELHLYRFDRSLGKLVTQFAPGTNWTNLIDWAYNIRIAAGNHWEDFRSLKRSLRLDEAPKPPTTSIPKMPVIPVNDAKAACQTCKESREIASTGQCASCGWTKTCSCDCKSLKKQRSYERLSSTLH